MLKKVTDILTRPGRNRTISSLAVIAVATLAITIPFAGQAFSIDGTETLAYAERQVEHPFAQDLPDHFNNRGILYDSFLETHPKFLPLYLSLVIRAAGEPSEVLIHLSLAFFPFIGAAGMFFLGRRFRVSGLAAALLFLAAPMLMVNTHTEMVDAPGTCLLIAAVALYISAVDRRSRWLLGLSTLLMILAGQTFFQGLIVLPLALVYLVINRRFQLRNFIPIICTALFFAAYLLAVRAAYGQFPRFSYRERLNTVKPSSLLEQARGNLTVLGGTLLMPLAAVGGFFLRWTSALTFVAASAMTWSWSLVRYVMGQYSLSEAVLLSIMLPTGITIAYLVIERAGAALFRRAGRDPRTGRDTIFLATWFFGVLAYALFLLPYPAPRYLLPVAPAAVLILLRFWRENIRHASVRFALGGAAVALTLVLGTMLSLTALHTANDGKAAAQWAMDRYSGSDGAWYNGTFGFEHYLKSNGFRLVPGVENELYAETARPFPLEEPRPGDHVVYSARNGAWVPYPSVMQRLRGDDTLLLYNDDIFFFPCTGTETCWWNSVFLPFDFFPGRELSDQVIAWRIDEKPNPLSESQRELYREVGINNVDELSEK
jgi:hypothetical protein